MTAFFMAAGLSAAEARRLALVVGNSDYSTVSPLKNAARDARDVAAALERLGFEVTLLTDVQSSDFWDRIDTFADSAETAESTLFFYSGHAFQMSGVNYLVPVDAQLQSREAIRTETWNLDGIIARLQNRKRQTLIFLDACRNDPLPQSVRGSGQADGLARLQTGVGTFVAFATEPGAVTYDGAGDAPNSPFTTALLKHIEAPGLSVSDMMIKVRNEVEEATLRRQTPWDQSSLREQFYFAEAPSSGKQELSEADYELLASLTPEDRAKFLDLLRMSGFSAESLQRADEAISIAQANLEIVAEADVTIIAAAPGSAAAPVEAAGADLSALEIADTGVTVVGGDAPEQIAALPEEPAPAQPEQIAALPEEPAPAQPEQIAALPEEPAPAQPEQIAALPEEPAPAQPEQIAALPEEPAPAQPEQIAALPEEPAPAQPEQIAALPEEPAPVQPEQIAALPEEPAPAQPEQIAALPEEPAPAQPEQIAALPEEPAPAQPEQIAVAPVTPEPLLPTPEPSALPPLGADIGPPVRVAALTWETRGILELNAVSGDRDRVAGNEVTADNDEGRALLAAIDPRLLDDSDITLDMNPREMARSAQAELKRLGCYQLAVDGSWGNGSRTALTSYFLAKRQVPDTLEPTPELIAQLRLEGKVVCEVRVAKAVVAGKTRPILKQEPAKVTKAGVRNPKTNRVVATQQQRVEQKKKVAVNPGGF
ncbi:MAG: caspase family protein [Paracoccaceae bacterium]|nr:MAG: caspase family protein [Paracoccaceae bacterium]